MENSSKTSNKKNVKLDAMEIAVLCTQLSMNLKAGISLYDGVSAVSEDTKDSRLKTVIDSLNESLTERKSLGTAMEESEAFPQYVVSMVEIGDASGTLEEVLYSLADYYMRQKAMKDRVRSAVIYPFMLFVMLSAVTILLVTKIIPVFEDIFQQLSGEIAGDASQMMSLGRVGGIISAVLVVVILLLFILYLVASKTEKGHLWGQRLMAGTPFTRKLSEKMISHKFAAAMYLMLSSGATVEDALDMTKAVMDNPYIEKKLDQCKNSMLEGKNFVQAMTELQVFPALFLRLTEVGTKTGYLSDTMKKLADIYEEETDTALNNLTSYIEPCMVGILALVIGGVLISVMLPLAGILSSIG